MKPANFPENPKYLWDIFYQFTQTPRPSRFEDKIRNYLISLAVDNKLKHVVDNAGNVIIYVPGKNGREKDESLLIQNHIDMVTDALQSRDINFKTDPILTKVDGDWLKAEGTTLGADNGIGCAAALACIFDETLIHPPLELLFTVDEETGLNGALGLEHKYLNSKKMLNLDTEEWGSLYIGCAGGIDYELTREYEVNTTQDDKKYLRVQFEGLVGGHSGVDIHEQRGNAIKVLADYLTLLNGEISFDLCEIRGGKAHNIIPRDAFAIIAIDKDDEKIVLNAADKVILKWKNYLPKMDENLKVVIIEENATFSTLSPNHKIEILSFLTLFPHGAHAYDLEDRSLVSISNNLARFLLVNGKLYTQSSLRFFDREQIKEIEQKLLSLGEMFSMKVENHSEYPSWKPVRENPVLELVKSAYEDLYKEIPKVTAIHAGLECGILRDKIGPIDVVSFGPTIAGAHSPDERVNIPSVEKFWDLFKLVLERI